METFGPARPKPSAFPLLVSFLVGLVLCFGGVRVLQHTEVENLIAAGFLPWGNTGFYIRILPGHSLSLVQEAARGSNLADAFLPSFMGGFVGFFLADLWVRRRVFIAAPKSGLAVLAQLGVLSFGLFVGFCNAMVPPRQATINLDANTISSSELGPSPLNAIGSFGYEIKLGTKNSSRWEVGLQTVNGEKFDIIPVLAAPPFQEYNELPQLIARTMADFVTSHGTKFPTNLAQT